MNSPRYTLITLFVVTSFAGLSVALWNTNRKLRQARHENTRLKFEVSEFRRDLGYLEIGDESKIHAIALPTVEDLTWRWRIYSPRNLELHWGFGGISSEGLDAEFARECGFLEEGEQVLTCAVRKTEQGEWLLVRQTSLDQSTNGVGLPRGCQLWFTEQRGVAFAVSGVGFTQVVSEPSDPLVLLRQREHGFTENTNEVKNDPPAKMRDGLLIWLAPRSRRR